MEVCIGIDDLQNVGFCTSYFDKILIFSKRKIYEINL